MAWVAVDKDGTEKIFSTQPMRRNGLISFFGGLITYYDVRRAYTKNKQRKWCAGWQVSPDMEDPLPETCIEIPKGSIQKLIGYKLTWRDEPVELKEQIL